MTTSFAEEAGPGAQLLRAVFDLGNITNPNRGAAARADDDFSELLGRVHASQRAQPKFLWTGNHASARSFNVFAAEGVAHIEDREVVRGKLLRVEQNANLPRLPSVQVDAADAIDGLDGAADLLVSDLCQFTAAERAGDQHGHDGIGLRVLLGHYGRQSIARQAIGCGGDFFANVLRRAFDVALKNEGAGDFREAFGGVDSDFVDAAHRRDGVFERKNHAGDDLLGRRARELHLHVYGGGVGFRK